MPSWWPLVYSALLILIPFVMLFVVPRNRDPSSAIAWLMLIAFLPIAGLIIFLVLGSPKLPRQRRRKQAAIDDLIAEAAAESRAHGDAHEIDARYAGLGRLIEGLGGFPPTPGNQVHVLADYDETIASIARDIDKAQRFVHLQYYILALDHATEPVFAAMERAVARGIPVRVMFDHVGSWKFPKHHAMIKRLSDAGIEWSRMLPFLPLAGKVSRPDLRNHRKIVVIDGAIAYAGSQNMIDASYLSAKNIRAGVRYKEIVFRGEGPIARALDGVFRMDWYAETDELVAETSLASPTGSTVAQVLPSGSAHPHENNLLLFNQLAYRAKQRLVLINPYFVPDASFARALETAAQRGVDVRLITCAQGDHRLLNHAQRSYYEELLRAGVKVFLYPPPTLLHTKTVTIDDDLAIIGSSNLDMRSFHLNLEVSTLFYGPEVNAAVRRVEETYLAGCQQIHLETWLKRPLPGQLFDGIARLTAHLQ